VVHYTIFLLFVNFDLLIFAIPFGTRAGESIDARILQNLALRKCFVLLFDAQPRFGRKSPLSGL